MGGLFVLDYPGLRPEPPVARLGLADHGWALTELLAGRLPVEVSAAAYTRRLLERAPRGDVAAILAFCAAAVLAEECAAQLEAAGHPPVPLVVFNVTPVTPRDVRAAWAEALSGVGGEARSPIDVEGFLDRPRELLRLMEAELAERSRARLRGLRLSAEVLDEVVAESVRAYVDWLRHLLVVLTRADRERDGQVLHVVSRDHPFRGRPCGGRVRTVVIGRDRTELLSARETRELVLGFLAENARAGGRRDRRARPAPGGVPRHP